MNAAFSFLYALFGVACAYGLWRRANRQGFTLTVAAWAAFALWYVSVGMGMAFTLVNLDGLHRRATLIGGIGTLAAALVIGLVVYRLATPKKIRSH